MSAGFRFGVTVGDVGDGTSWTATARRVEEAGYGTLLLPETVHSPAPLPALAAAAGATSSLHVGTWVLCEPLHAPARLVWEARTLRDLFPGRVELGLGAGRPGADRDAAALELPYGSPGERIDRLASTVERLRAELPDLHLLIAASGPRLLRLAATVADTVALGWAPDTDVAAARSLVDAVREGAGDAPGARPELAAGLIAVNDSAAPWLSHIGSSVAELAGRGAVTVVTGSPREMADQLQRRRDELGVGYVTVPAVAATAFAPVVELLAGR